VKHLDEQEIAVLIEGRVGKEERARFLKHLAECETCFAVYSETLQYVEEEKKSKLSVLPAIGIRRRISQSAAAFVQSRPLRLAAVSLMLILLVVWIGIKEHRQVKVEKAQLNHIEERFIENDNGVHAFSTSRNIAAAALKAGLMVETLSILIDIGDDKLTTEIIFRLKKILEILFEKKIDRYILESNLLDGNKLQTLIKQIKKQVETQHYRELFQLGRFIEKCINRSFYGKVPKPVEIKKYLEIALKNESNIPIGVMRKMKQLRSTLDSEQIRMICEGMEDVLLSL
jgi:hypothetical protein